MTVFLFIIGRFLSKMLQTLDDTRQGVCGSFWGSNSFYAVLDRFSLVKKKREGGVGGRSQF